MLLDERRPDDPLESGVLAPYLAPHEHIHVLLRRHDLRLKRLIARAQLRKPGDILGFAAISEDEVSALLDARVLSAASSAEVEAIDRELGELELEIDGRVEQSDLHGIRLPILELAGRFALSPLEMDLLFTCLAVELDRRYERVYGFLQDDMTRRLASAGLAMALCCDSVVEQLNARELLNAQAPLRHYGLLELADDGSATPWLSRPMRVDERVASFLIGDRALDARVARQVTWYEAALELVDPREPRHPADEALERIVQVVRASRGRRKSLLYLQSARRAGADALVRRAARCLGMPVMAVDAELLVESGRGSGGSGVGGGGDFEQNLFLLFREGLLSQAAVYLRNLERALEPPAGASRYRALLRCATEMGSIVFASGEHPWCWQIPAEPLVLRIVEVRPDGVDEQLDAWRAASRHQLGDAELHHLISLHPLPVAVITDVWRMAEALAAEDDDDAAPSFDQVKQACRAFGGTPVSAMARRVEPKHRWADLVLPAAQLEQLAAICSQAKHSSIVYGSWQFERKLSLGRGLNALFTGPPGTGKTMAAEVIAGDLGVDILKIDLSQIVSKYIGETEKNLRQLFDQAVAANAILFFDEADALLGKRSDVKDAHDRYANTETAYLLQKMEEYPGIAILSTNLRQNMDAAFTRRMRFIVDFPFPEEEDRLRIWKTVWPSEVPLGTDVDFDLLARQFRLSGGSIRNVALAAAFLAAEQHQDVSMRHLMRATKRELQKMGRLVSDEESGAPAPAGSRDAQGGTRRGGMS